MKYRDFLKSKSHADDQYGFEPLWLPDYLFPFQGHLTGWSIKKGRSATLADCGLGKSIMELVWCENIVRKFNKPTMILTPLSVSSQFVREGEKFGIDAKVSRNGKVYRGINVTNYERLHYFNPSDFEGVVCDESGCLKNFDGTYRKLITKFIQAVPHRLLASATPAPNDYMELGSSSEALGAMSRNHMLGMFFRHESDDTQQWTLKGHAKKRFWKWVCTWARAIRKPSDLGFDDTGFILPPLTTRQHVVQSTLPSVGFGLKKARTLDEQRAERRSTIKQRCEKVAEMVSKKRCSVIWCHLNPEGDLLERLIPDAVQISGADKDERKEEVFNAFARGDISYLITKPKIAGFGMNWQHCAHMTFFPSHSFESFYQAVRRCWRFGQKNPVEVDIVTSEAESLVMSNMQRKERQANEMFSHMIEEMNEFQLERKVVDTSEAITYPRWL